jgi:tetratricopeptide (TPR) repeat protein
MVALRGQRHEQAIRYLRRTLDLRQEMLREDPRNAVAALRVAAALNRIGLAYREWGRYPEAIRYGRESLTAVRTVHQADPKNLTAGRELVFALSDLALTHQKAADMPNACRLARETVSLSKGIPPNAQLKASYEKMTLLAQSCSARPR